MFPIETNAFQSGLFQIKSTKEYFQYKNIVSNTLLSKDAFSPTSAE